MDKINRLLEITPNMSDEKADLFGVMVFSQLMLMRLIEKRETGLKKYTNWHNNSLANKLEHDNELRVWAEKCIKEERWVDAANLCMMLELRKTISEQ